MSKIKIKVKTNKTNGTKYWYKNGELYRLERPSSHKVWYLNGELHRVNGPALENEYGDKYWLQNGKYHRLDGPAVEDMNGTKCWYFEDEYHRLDGPAIEYAHGGKCWFQHGKMHRLDGPAEIYPRMRIQKWWINGKRLRELQIKDHQINRIQSITIALSPLELPPYVILWILQWSESAYIHELSEIAIVKILEGIRNSCERIKIEK